MEVLDFTKLKKCLSEFSESRNWQKFHSPKNICMALSVETSELVEHFQWLTNEESYKYCLDKQNKVAVSEEIADIMIYLTRLSDLLDIDIPNAVEDKIEKNAKKYPEHKCQGTLENIKKLKSEFDNN